MNRNEDTHNRERWQKLAASEYERGECDQCGGRGCLSCRHTGIRWNRVRFDLAPIWARMMEDWAKKQK
jgi:hypothetical protein